MIVTGYHVTLHCRSQCKREEKKELREKQLKELHSKLAWLEGELTLAETEKKQCHTAVKRGQEKEAELR